MKFTKRIGTIILVLLLAFHFTVSANASSLSILSLKAFNPKDYNRLNPDIAYVLKNKSDTALKKHYQKYGVKEGRNIGNFIDVEKYRDAYPDLNTAFGDNWEKYYEHYLRFGIKEGRNKATIDIKEYAKLNPDVKATFQDNFEKIYEHYLKYGIKEHRQIDSAPKSIPTPPEPVSIPKPTPIPTPSPTPIPNVFPVMINYEVHEDCCPHTFTASFSCATEGVRIYVTLYRDGDEVPELEDYKLFCICEPDRIHYVDGPFMSLFKNEEGIIDVDISYENTGNLNISAYAVKETMVSEGNYTYEYSTVTTETRTLTSSQAPPPTCSDFETIYDVTIATLSGNSNEDNYSYYWEIYDEDDNSVTHGYTKDIEVYLGAGNYTLEAYLKTNNTDLYEDSDRITIPFSIESVQVSPVTMTFTSIKTSEPYQTKIDFDCDTENVTYHITSSLTDTTNETNIWGTVSQNTLSFPNFTTGTVYFHVYATKDGYEDSPIQIQSTVLEAIPLIASIEKIISRPGALIVYASCSEDTNTTCSLYDASNNLVTVNWSQSEEDDFLKFTTEDVIPEGQYTIMVTASLPNPYYSNGSDSQSYTMIYHENNFPCLYDFEITDNIVTATIDSYFNGTYQWYIYDNTNTLVDSYENHELSNGSIETNPLLDGDYTIKLINIPPTEAWNLIASIKTYSFSVGTPILAQPDIKWVNYWNNHIRCTIEPNMEGITYIHKLYFIQNSFFEPLNIVTNISPTFVPETEDCLPYFEQDISLEDGFYYWEIIATKEGYISSLPQYCSFIIYDGTTDCK